MQARPRQRHCLLTGMLGSEPPRQRRAKRRSAPAPQPPYSAQGVANSPLRMSSTIRVTTHGPMGCQSSRILRGGRGYRRAADGPSFCTPADGVIVQIICCTD